MADRGPNPDLWMVKSGLVSLSKLFLYTKVFIAKSSDFTRASESLAHR